eukprot:COSAG01_NODE_6429_length_3670_cov_6.618594_3_plen_99_part_00
MLIVRRLLQRWELCVVHLHRVADVALLLPAEARPAPAASSALRRQRSLVEQVVTTLDGCLARLGRRDQARALRERAAAAGVYGQPSPLLGTAPLPPPF